MNEYSLYVNEVNKNLSLFLCFASFFCCLCMAWICYSISFNFSLFLKQYSNFLLHSNCAFLLLFLNRTKTGPSNTTSKKSASQTITIRSGIGYAKCIDHIQLRTNTFGRRENIHRWSNLWLSFQVAAHSFLEMQHIRLPGKSNNTCDRSMVPEWQACTLENPLTNQIELQFLLTWSFVEWK